MRIIIVLLITLTFHLIARSQQRTHLTKKDGYTEVVKTQNPFSEVIYKIPPNSWVSLLKTINNQIFYIKYDTITGYILSKDLSMTLDKYEIDSINNGIKRLKDSIELNKLNNQILLLQSKTDSLSKYLELFEKTLCENCLYANAIPSSEYKNIYNLNITVLSKYKKSIKYITFYVQAFNPVNDKIGPLIENKAVGPINYNENVKYDFDNAIISKSLKYIKLIKVKVEFMDKTIVILRDKQFSYSAKSQFYMDKISEFMD